MDTYANIKFFRVSSSNLSPRFCSFVHRHYCLNQPFQDQLLSQRPFNHLLWHPIESLLQIRKTDKKLSILFRVAFLHSLKNKNSVRCAFARHKTKFHLVNFYQPSQPLLQLPFHLFHTML